jgi:hypothetical protein
VFIDKENIVKKAFYIVMIGFLILSLSATFTPVMSQGVDEFVDFAVVSPLGAINTKLPDYTFAAVATATKYRVKVYTTASPDVPVYILKGSGNCSFPAGVCYLRPDLKLKVLDFYGKGYYFWTLEAKLNGVTWHMVFDHNEFQVYSQGFNSTFVTLNKWLNFKGTWSIVDPGYLKTKPPSGYYSSILHTHRFADDYVYEVMMKRKAEEAAPSFIIIQGQPDFETAGTDAWYSGLIFAYNNLGKCSVNYWKNHSIATYISWTSVNCNVVPYGWNKLTAYVSDGDVSLYVNDVLFQTIPDAITNYASPTGYMGIGGIDDDSLLNALFVDYAKVYQP